MTAQTSTPSSFILPGQPLPPAPAPSSSSSSSSSSVTLTPSNGVYTRSSYTLSSLTGQVHYHSSESSSSSKKTSQSKSKSASNGPTSTSITASIKTPLSPHLRLPEPDSIVLARITRITSRQALCSILLVGSDSGNQIDDDADAGAGATGTLSINQALSSGVSNHAAGEDPAGLDFSGVIRQQDVRLTDVDKVKMAECFRVGDLVRAKVVSLGDSRSYYLTTASNELGVIFATASHPSDVLPITAQAADAFLPASLHQHTQRTNNDSADIPGALKPLNWQEMIHPLTGAIEKRKVAKPQNV